MTWPRKAVERFLTATSAPSSSDQAERHRFGHRLHAGLRAELDEDVPGVGFDSFRRNPQLLIQIAAHPVLPCLL